MHWLKINIIKGESVPNTTDSIAKILYLALVLRHKAYTIYSDVPVSNDRCRLWKLIPVDIHQVKYDLIGKHQI